MFYNYSYFEEETTPKDEHVEEEIEILLEQINNEKRKVMADLYNEKIRIDPEEREKEGKTINDLTCEIMKQDTIVLSNFQGIKR